MRESFEGNLLSFRVDSEGFLYVRDILIELSSRFPLSLQEALVLVNDHLRDQEIALGDLFYHETPEAWSKDMYWGHNQYWWKRGEERQAFGLPELKPVRPDRLETYELREGGQRQEGVEDMLFFPVRLQGELKKLGLLPDDHKKVWSAEALNYNVALEELYKYKGWGKYSEE